MRLRQHTSLTLAAACSLLFTLILDVRPGCAQPTSTALQSLQQDVETLKTDVAEMKKDLAEIRKLLSQRPTQAAQPAPAANMPSKVSVGDGPSLGQPDAPVTVVEFSDYQCPFCARFVKQTFPELKADYIDTGKVRYVFRDFPLDAIHPQARKAAEAAHCAREQDKYWEMHDMLFTNQKTLKVENLKHFARLLGLDADAFNTCLDNGAFADAVTRHQAAGSQAGVTGTPGFFIGKTGPEGTMEATFLKGAQPLAAFRQVIDRLLEGHKP